MEDRLERIPDKCPKCGIGDLSISAHIQYRKQIHRDVDRVNPYRTLDRLEEWLNWKCGRCGYEARAACEDAPWLKEVPK